MPTREAEAGSSLSWGQLGLQREFKDSQGYTDRNSVLKNHEKKKKKTEKEKKKKRKIEIHKEEIRQDFCILFGIWNYFSEFWCQTFPNRNESDKNSYFQCKNGKDYHPPFRGTVRGLTGWYLNLTFLHQHWIVIGVFWHTEDLMGRASWEVLMICGNEDHGRRMIHFPRQWREQGRLNWPYK